MTAGTGIPRGVIGASIPRKEDPRLLRGLGRFGADFTRPGQLWARVVRSPVAHGRLRSVDTARAAQADGVVTVVTAASLPPGLAIPVRLQVQDADLRAYLQPVLAADTVRYVGEPVAVVVAGDPYAAEDAAELVDTDIDEAPAVLDAAAAAAPGAPALFPGGNVAADFTLGYGDVAGAFARADRDRGDRGGDRAARRGPAGAAGPAGRPRPGHRRAVDLRDDQGAGVQPGPAGLAAGHGRDPDPRARGGRGRRVRRAR